MPLVRIIQVSGGTKLGIWRIAEPESFFRDRVHNGLSINHPYKRLQHLSARFLLPELFHDFPLSDIRTGPGGKPFLPQGDFYLSLSHSGEYAAAMAGREGMVGIDIEKITPKVGRVAHKFLNPSERTFIGMDNPVQLLTVCWCAKEAVFKWYGRGEVDFQVNMNLQPFVLQQEGNIQCCFSKGNMEKILQVGYSISPEYVVAWTMTGNEEA